MGFQLPERIHRQAEEESSLLTPLFYQKVSSTLSKKNLAPHEIFLEEFDELSRYLDKTAIQESCSVRNVLKARLVAAELINDHGDFQVEKLPRMIADLKASLYSLAPYREVDIVRDRHLLHVLELLLQDASLQRFIKNIRRPVSNRLAEEIIRETVGLSPSTAVHDAHVRRAVMHAWLVFPRQSLGSCFATAPCIVIQEEMPHLFLRDLDEMLNTGRLKRTFNGVEYSVPMCSSWGNGDLKKPIFIGDDTSFQHKIGMQPGLVAACESVSLIDATLPLKVKVHQLTKLIKASWSHLQKRGHIVTTCVEEILENILLQHHGITRKEIEEYETRPQAMVATGLMLHVPKTSKFTSKGDPIQAYRKDLNAAKIAFKMLADSALLKVWEFTVASFSEVKLDFARFNLYASLGINHDDKGGIGECLYRFISQKIDQANLYLKERQDEYEQIAGHVRYIEQRIRTSSTEKEVEWLKVDYQSKIGELNHIEELKRMAYEKATKTGKLYDFLIGQYDQKFPNYFQEVYDPDIHDIAAGPFDDSPAGFRLLYKYGRSNPSQWTRIHSLSEFVESLVSFFTLTEQEISSSEEIKGIEGECSMAITQLVNHVRADSFLESSFWRMSKAHNAPLLEKPLQHLDKIEKKPWVYTSGGSMSILVSSYFKRDEKPTEVSRWVESETELFAFLLDSLKHQPVKTMQAFLDDPNKSMLMHSPTHAFLLKPGLQKFSEGWQSDMYTYSWIKHHVIEPAEEALRSYYIEEEGARFLIKQLLQKIPHNARPRFKELFSHFPYHYSVKDFYADVVNRAHSDRGVKAHISSSHLSDLLSSLLFSHLPFTGVEKAKISIVEILASVFEKEKASSLHALIDRFFKPEPDQTILSSQELYTTLKTFSELVLGATRTPSNIEGRLIHEMRKRNLMTPEPIVFADSNWIKDYFAFVVSPISHALEFWSVDYFGITGTPVSHWKMWLNGSRRDSQWGIFIKPEEYFGH